ncbi:alpha/beta fold hydrolase [Saccharothrix syringae]|uniref:Alpha/beta hydrolase n=1 Tax=Saccharothrix syringae TaxID=103733 RepID=A0A5Q0GZ32_SACSY|nr:alpha/beta hydrolase [Saccharothrix syringae]QFZ19198.1 alpha/beta hydrolase [Saccharothrix syringae]
MDYTVDRVRVAGATLHVETTGTGPALVLIPGGGGDAGLYAEVVPLLAGRFTVITFDRRGNSRSPLDGGSTPVGVPEQAADVVAVLDHHRVDRAHVFGSSGGAIIALELLAGHRDRLLGAVVHEPPLVQLLPGSPEQRELDRLRRIADTEGPLRGFVAFATMTMPTPPRLFRHRAGRALVAAALWLVRATGTAWRRVTGRAPGGMARLVGNTGVLMRRELPAFCHDYRPDLDALRSAHPPWWLATGRDSAGRPYHRPAHVLGGRLGVPVVEFPGGHTAYQRHAEDFARCLIELLTP